MKKLSTLLLRGVVILFGFAVLAACFFPVRILTDDTVGKYTPIAIGMLISVIPFLLALQKVLVILSFIDRNKVLSVKTARGLGQITRYALSIAGLYTIMLPYLFYVGDQDDAPGVLAFGLLFITLSLIVVAVTVILQKVLQHALDIKSENDLTV